jgi:hypothetical protein
MTENQGHDNLVRLASYLNPHEAHIAKAVLESHGILAFVFDTEMNMTYSLYGIALGGVRLMVREADFKKARDILTSITPLEADETPR